jgi:hypothetical protein
MTQSAQPFPGVQPTPEVSVDEYGNVRFKAPAAPTTQVAPVAPPKPTFLEESQKRLAESQKGVAEQQKAEEEHGALATVATHAARGFLDGILWTGSMVGLAAESAGAVTGIDTLRDFGRDVGESASGQALFETGAEAWDLMTGGSKRAGLTGAEKAKQAIEGQKKAWPMLSAVSHAAGMVGEALLAGGLTHAAASAKAAVLTGTEAVHHFGTAAQMGISAAEGAGVSAQAAYEERKPLSEVLTAAVIGGGIGAAAGALPTVISKFNVRNRLENFANQETFTALGGSGKIRKFGSTAEQAIENAKEMAQHFREAEFADGTRLFRKTADFAEHAAAADRRLEELGPQLGAIRGTTDEAIAAIPELQPNVNEIAEKIKGKVIDPILKSSLKINREGPEARELLGYVDDLKALGAETEGRTTLEKLYNMRSEIDDKLYQAKKAAQARLPFQGASDKNLEKLRFVLEDSIADTVKKAEKITGTPAFYDGVKNDYHLIRQARDVARDAAMAQMGKNWSSLTDKGAGAAVLVARMASGDPFAIAEAAGTMLISKAIRKRASGVLSGSAADLAGYLSRLEAPATGAFTQVAEEGVEAGGASLIGRLGNRLEHGLTPTIHSTAEMAAMGSAEGEAGHEVIGHGARRAAAVGGSHLTKVFGERPMPEVPLELAGGRESQEVLTQLQRAKRHVYDSETRAGPNPDQQQLARHAAKESIAIRIAEKAGPYDATQWHAKAPKPLQKAVYRTLILDAISNDIAKDAAEAPQPVPVEIDPDRLQKLTEDADGPTAIGGVQQRVNDLLEQVPPVPEGYELAFKARGLREKLGKTNVPETMMLGHELAKTLRETASTSQDPTVKSWALRQAAATEQALGSDAFGSAGAAYKQAHALPSESLAALSDPAQAREVLRRAESKGVLLKPLSEQRDAAVAAAAASELLSGKKGAKRDVAQKYRDLEDKFAKAEDSVLFDGAGAGNIKDYFDDQLDNRMGSTVGNDLTQVTANAVRPKLEQIAPILRGSRFKRSEPRAQGGPTRSTLAEVHKLRMEGLADMLGDVDSLAMSQEALKAFPKVDDALQNQVGQNISGVLSQLYKDLPKPSSDLRGKSYASLSSDDLRKANAMWNATFDPMGMVDDFRNGVCDYDRVEYTHKQYPALMMAAQAGLIDLLGAQLNAKQRESIPDPILSQVDYLFGFGGKLQSTVDYAFGQRMEQAAQQEQQAQSQQGGGGGGRLQLPSNETGPQRIARGRG